MNNFHVKIFNGEFFPNYGSYNMEISGSGLRDAADRPLTQVWQLEVSFVMF